MKKIKFNFLIFLLLEIYCLPPLPNMKRQLEETKSDDIVILHTNDVHCGIQDSIGYDGLMLYKKQMLSKYKNVILVDAGDHIQGGTVGLLTNGEAIIDIMNKVGYDVVNIGAHEFDYGVDKLKELSESLNCGYISSNFCFRKNKTSLYPAYKLIERGGKIIAFIGVTTPHALSKTDLRTIYDEDGNILYHFLTDNNNKELYDRIQSHIDDVKSQGVYYVIILSHLGIEGDIEEENTSINLLKNIKNVDALIDGNTHLVYSKTTKDKEGKDIIIAQTGTKLNNIGVLIIHTDGTITQQNIDTVPYDPNFEESSLEVFRKKKTTYVDSEMNQFIMDKYNFISDKLDIVIGYSDFPLNIYEVITEKKQPIYQLSRKDENILCNLIADAFRYFGDADISIINAGSIKDDINEGDITIEEILNILPFSNDILVKEITGQVILDALEFGVRNLPESSPNFPQVSGITYKIDTSISSSVIVDDDESFIRVDGDRRVYEVKVNGESLDLNKKYTISSDSFILCGGNGFSMFVNYDILKQSFGVDSELLMKYIEEYLGGSIPIKYMKKEGRIAKTYGKVLEEINSEDKEEDKTHENEENNETNENKENKENNETNENKANNETNEINETEEINDSDEIITTNEIDKNKEATKTNNNISSLIKININFIVLLILLVL